MFPLAGKDFPTTSDELATSIQDKLEEVFTLSKKGGVTASGGTFPDVKRLKVDLSGATVSATEPPPKPQPAGKRQPGVTVDQFEVLGKPVQYEKSKVNFGLTASGVRLDYAKDKKGNPLLVLAGADEGEAEAQVSKADIESLAMAVAGAAAKQQGVTVQDLSVNLTSEGDRSVAAEVRVKAKKLMMSGVIHVRGKLDVDDELNATVSDLSCKGEGVVGTMAAGLIQKKLQEYNGRRIPLMAFSLGDVALRDLKIDTKGGLRVTAKFGK